MKKLNYFLFALILVLSGCQNDKPILFSGLMHSPIGNAKIRIDKNLVVTNFEEVRKDGVSIDLGKSQSWAANFAFKNADKTQLIFDVLGNGTENESIKSLSEIVLKFESNKVLVSTKFSTPANDLKLFHNDSLVYRLMGFPSKTQIEVAGMIGHGDGDDEGDLEGKPHIKFLITPNGVCLWQFKTGKRDIILNTEIGHLSGNRLTIAEHPDEGRVEGNMLFQKMNITASRTDTLIIFSESVEK